MKRLLALTFYAVLGFGAVVVPVVSVANLVPATPLLGLVAYLVYAGLSLVLAYFLVHDSGVE